MPFDGTNRAAAPVVAHPVAAHLDRALALLGPNGEGWVRGVYFDYGTRRCAVGALRDIRLETFPAALKALTCAIPMLSGPYDPDHRAAERFNDNFVRNFAEVRAWFERAKRVAVMMEEANAV